MATRDEKERIAALEMEVRKDREHIVAALEDLKDSQTDHFDKFEKRLSEVERRLSGHENKGKGILIGVGMAAAVTGASVLAFVERILGVFK